MAYRLARLSEFLRDPSFGHLLSDLAEDVDALPQCFVDCIFVVSTSTAETVVKNLVDHNVLLMQLDNLKCHTHTTPRKQRLQTLLEHAFIDKKLGRTVDESLILEHSTSSDFAGAFNGPALMLLHDHLIVHNSLFPALKPPERVHAIATPVNDAEDEDGTLTKTREYYAKVLPILQSSGFGKTRMCVQLGTRHPGMLVCLRHLHHSDRHRISFPPQDATVYDYFIKVTSAIATLHTPQGGLKIPVTSAEHKACNDGHLRIIAWLAVYCNTLVHYLEQLKHDSGCFHEHDDCGATSERHDPESCWRTVVYCFAHATSFKQLDFFQIPQGLCRHSRLMERLSWPSISTTAFISSISGGSSRSQQSVAEARMADETAMLAPPALIGTPDLRNKILDHICTLADTRYDAMLTEYASVLDDDNMLIGAIAHHLRDPIDALENLSPKHAAQTFCFLALDECASIARILPLIRRVWFHASPLSTWILLVDTNSDLAPLAGTAARTGSRWTSEYDTHRLSQPFSAMPLDVNLTSQDRQRLFFGSSNHESTQSKPSMRELNLTLPKLGRPLWSDKKYQSEGVVNPKAIIGKLIRADSWSWPDKGALPTSDPLSALHQNLLALASRRVPLELTSKAGPDKWYAFVSQQIAHHLRFVGRIYSTSETIISSTPSEPPLSAAAAWFFRSNNINTTAARWGSAVQAIVNALAPVGIDTGAQGEQGVALVCTMALDLAVSKRHGLTLQQSLSEKPNVQQEARYEAVFGLVTVREWLDMLIGRAPPTRIDNPLAAAKQAPSDDESHHHGLPSELVAWAERTWLNFKHIVRLPKQVPHDAKTIGPGLLVELWFRHAAAQGIVNQPGWDFLIPVYETDDLSAPSGDHIFDKHRLSYVAIQVKNSLQRPGVETLKANVGPKVQVAEGKSKHCLELFIDLRAQGHDCIYTRRPSLPTPPTLPETAQELVRHHVRMGSSALCVLDRLKTPAKDQVGMLFGNADSLDTLEFDDEHAKYVRQLTDRHEHQSAWADAQTRVQGALVSVTEQPD